MCKGVSLSAPVIAEKKEVLEKEDQWLETFDLEAWTAEIRALGKTLERQQGPADVRHLNKMISWSNGCGIIGFLTMGFSINWFSIIGLSTFTFSRWTMIAHHTCHGGYDKCHPNKNRWNRFRFGVGTSWRRFCDWFDWMLPEAWNVEHNNRHHYNLSEIEDPDLVENNTVDIREAQWPLFAKYMLVMLNVVTWKWAYYAPNTYKELKLAKLRRQGKPIPEGVDPSDAVTVKTLLMEGSPFYSGFEFIQVVLGPYFLYHFFILPLPFLFLGETFGVENMYGTAVKNLFLAELFTNFHGFVAVVTNHAGDDMYRFREGCRPHSGSFYLRQVLSSVNFWTFCNLNDFLHGFLNYQIEHHLWPNLTMLSYQKAQPLVKEICGRYGVPYVQENVFTRVKKTVDIMVGTSSMRWLPESYEKKYLQIDAKCEALKRMEVRK